MSATPSAEEHFDNTFREVGVTEFFRKNLHMLGYGGKIKSMTTIIHEFITNSLDACEESGILPDLHIEIGRPKSTSSVDEYKLVIKDNGPGIPKDYIGRVFGKMLSGTKFHRYIQSRGQQGIGAVGAILYSQMTTGKSAKIVSSTGDGQIHIGILEIDTKQNKPKVHELFTEEGEGWRGVRVEIYYKDVLYSKSEQGAYEYIRRTAIANPHMQISLIEPDGKKEIFSRTTEIIPPKPKEMKPHPYGVTADDLRQMALGSKPIKLKSFLTDEFSRISVSKAEQIGEIAKVDLNIKTNNLTHSTAEKIVTSFKEIKFIAPPTDGIITIGEKHIEDSLQEMLNPEFICVNERRPLVFRGGIPFQLEIGLAYGGGAGRSVGNGKRAEIMRFANKAPLIFDSGGCTLTKSAESIDWKRYRIKDMNNAPITIFINLNSPHIPYTSAGKQAIAEQEEINTEIRVGLMDLSRKLKVYLSGKHREGELKLKRDILLRYIDETSSALAEITGIDAKMISINLTTIVNNKIGVDTDE